MDFLIEILDLNRSQVWDVGSLERQITSICQSADLKGFIFATK